MTDFKVRRSANIAYASLPFRDKFREFDLYIPRTPPSRATQSEGDANHQIPPSQLSPVICFVHGGAWRSEDKEDHSRLAQRLAALTQFPVAVPNYRLTEMATEEEEGSGHVRHPAHAEDILQFLSFLIDWKGLGDGGDPGLGPPPYDPRKMYLMGHSCGAHILASILLDSSATSPTLAPSAPLLGAVQAIVMSEGIYDLDRLLASFPEYREWFVEAAFGKRRDSYAEFSVTTFPLRTPDPLIRWLVVHSKGDTLVDMAQSEAMYRHLCRLHEAVGARTEVTVARDIGELDEEHNAILSAERFTQVVGKFILADHLGHT